MQQSQNDGENFDKIAVPEEHILKGNVQVTYGDKRLVDCMKSIIQKGEEIYGTE
jgi:hypothetical protein